MACFLRNSAICGDSLARAFWPRADARDNGCTRSRTQAVNSTIAAAVAEPWKSGSSRSAMCATNPANTDMKEEKRSDMEKPSGGLVVPGVMINSA
ncbi:hypothetical protein SALBM135S_04328 [Streptomyces alboniger]